MQVLKLIDFGIAKTISNDTTNIVREAQVSMDDLTTVDIEILFVVVISFLV